MALKKATIVLEGGATRGIFTSGALDYLMEQDIYFSDVIGVSAGACNAVDYVSRQPGRTRDCMICLLYTSADGTDAVQNQTPLDIGPFGSVEN